MEGWGGSGAYPLISGLQGLENIQRVGFHRDLIEDVGDLS